MIPRFLECKGNALEGVYILHTQFPKFLAQVNELPDGSREALPILWFDELPTNNVMEAAKLMREMGDWYYQHLKP